MPNIRLTHIPALNNVIVPSTTLERPGVIRSVEAALVGTVSAIPTFDRGRVLVKLSLETNISTLIKADMSDVIPGIRDQKAEFVFSHDEVAEESENEEDGDAALTTLVGSEEAREALSEKLIAAIRDFSKEQAQAIRSASDNKTLTNKRAVAEAVVAQFLETLDTVKEALEEDGEHGDDETELYLQAVTTASEEAVENETFFLPNWLQENGVEIEGITNVFAEHLAGESTADDSEIEEGDVSDDTEIAEVDETFAASDGIVDFVSNFEEGDLSGEFDVDPILNVSTFMLAASNNFDKELRRKLADAIGTLRTLNEKLDAPESAVTEAIVSSAASATPSADPLETLGEDIAVKQEAAATAVGNLGAELRKAIEAKQQIIRDIYASLPAVHFSIPLTSVVDEDGLDDPANRNALLIQALIANVNVNPTFNPVITVAEEGRPPYVTVDLVTGVEASTLTKLNGTMQERIVQALDEAFVDL